MLKRLLFKIVATPQVSASVAYWISPNAALPCGSCVGTLDEIRAIAHRYASRQASMVVVIGVDGEIQEAREYVDPKEWLQDGADFEMALQSGRTSYHPVEVAPDSICLT